MTRTIIFLAALAAFSSPPVHAWDYAGHRMVNQLALASLPPDFPPFARTPEARSRIVFLAGEPDRWYNSPDQPLRHANAPDHYLDMEELALIDQRPASLSEFRQVFAAQLADARAKHPERFAPIDQQKNKDRTRELVGFLPWAISEYFGKLRSGFSYLKTYQEAGGTAEEISNAQQNILYIMGVMGHFVGDGAQPLHTTIHHHGWVGSNPSGYTTAPSFHAWIDGGFIAKTGISIDSLAPRVAPAVLLPVAVSGDGNRDPLFSRVVTYLVDQHAKVEPLYQLEKEGKLTGEKGAGSEGKPFIQNQLLIAGNMLGSLWLTAWKEAPIDNFLRNQLTQRHSGHAAQ